MGAVCCSVCGERGQPACCVHFDLDDRPLKANDGARVDLCEHSSSLDRTVGEVKCRVRLSLGLTAGWGQGSGGSSRAGKLSAPMPTVSQVVKPPSENAMAQWAPGGSSKAGTRILSWLPSTLARN